MNKLAKISERRRNVSKKVIYSIVIASTILGLAILLFFPSGIVSVAIVVLCFGLALFLISKKEGGENVTST